MQKAAVLDLFKRLAWYHQFTGDANDRFRVKTFEKAIEALSPLSDADITNLKPGKIPGIGDGICKRIRELEANGKLAELEALEGNSLLPPYSMEELVSIPGVGPKKAEALWQVHGIRSYDDLDKAVKAGTTITLPGMTHDKLVQAMSFRKTDSLRVARAEVYHVVQELMRKLDPYCTAVQPAGSFRRKKNTVRDLDIIVIAKDGASWKQIPAALGGTVVADGPSKLRLWWDKPHIQVDILRVPDGEFGAALQYLTGSKEHNVAVRSYALTKGLTLNEHGLTNVKTGARIAGYTEQGIYAALGLQCPLPEDREGEALHVDKGGPDIHPVRVKRG
jgi:DNA polymerase (family 10)